MRCIIYPPEETAAVAIRLLAAVCIFRRSCEIPEGALALVVQAAVLVLSGSTAVTAFLEELQLCPFLKDYSLVAFSGRIAALALVIGAAILCPFRKTCRFDIFWRSYSFLCPFLKDYSLLVFSGGIAALTLVIGAAIL